MEDHLPYKAGDYSCLARHSQSHKTHRLIFKNHIYIKILKNSEKKESLNNIVSNKKLRQDLKNNPQN